MFNLKQFMNRTVRATLPLALSLCFATSALCAKTTALSAKQVSLYANVEEKGKLIVGLQEDNFRLFVDSQPRPFVLEEPEAPASVALLVEYSQSSWVYFNDIDQALKGFKRSFPEGNWYALATFSNGLDIDVDFTKRIGEVVTGYESLGQPSWDIVNTYDAVYDMLDKMERLRGRKVLIVISSGLDSFSRQTLEKVRQKARTADVVIYSVGIGSLVRGMYEPYLSNIQRLDLAQSEAFLKMLASDTGGQAWLPTQETEYLDVMQGIAQDLQYQYRLVYDSQVPRDDRFHKIHVEAFTRDGADEHQFKVRVRKGWQAE